MKLSGMVIATGLAFFVPTIAHSQKALDHEFAWQVPIIGQISFVVIWKSDPSTLVVVCLDKNSPQDNVKTILTAGNLKYDARLIKEHCVGGALNEIRIQLDEKKVSKGTIQFNRF